MPFSAFRCSVHMVLPMPFPTAAFLPLSSLASGFQYRCCSSLLLHCWFVPPWFTRSALLDSAHAVFFWGRLLNQSINSSIWKHIKKKRKVPVSSHLTVFCFLVRIAINHNPYRILRATGTTRVSAPAGRTHQLRAGEVSLHHTSAMSQWLQAPPLQLRETWSLLPTSLCFTTPHCPASTGSIYKAWSALVLPSLHPDLSYSTVFWVLCLLISSIKLITGYLRKLTALLCGF